MALMFPWWQVLKLRATRNIKRQFRLMVRRIVINHRRETLNLQRSSIYWTPLVPKVHPIERCAKHTEPLVLAQSQYSRTQIQRTRNYLNCLLTTLKFLPLVISQTLNLKSWFFPVARILRWKSHLTEFLKKILQISVKPVEKYLSCYFHKIQMIHSWWAIHLDIDMKTIKN